MKVGLLIIDKGDRPLFMFKCLQYIERQTYKNFTLRIVNEPITGYENKVDIAIRYHLGFKDLFEKENCDCVVVMESDDWYHESYIQIMVDNWEKAGRPDLLGIESSVYYHIVTEKYSIFQHPGRSSMNTTLVSRNVLKHKFDYSSPYLDFHLYSDKQFTKATFKTNQPLCIGIKHGQGMVGGGGHQLDWQKYQFNDKGLVQLGKWAGQDVAFYRIMALKENFEISKKSVSENGTDEPVLSILTRQHGDKRLVGFKRNQESISEIEGTFEQIFIRDKKGLGVGIANHAFQLAVPEICGRWVYLTDDDDFITLPEIVREIERIEATGVYDVIMCRCTILNGSWDNHYPSPNVWKKKPLKAQIGGGCFVVRKEIFIKFIHHFGYRSLGDFYFIDEIFKHNPRVYWLDKIVSSTGGKPSHGRTEIN